MTFACIAAVLSFSRVSAAQICGEDAGQSTAECSDAGEMSSAGAGDASVVGSDASAPGAGGGPNSAPDAVPACSCTHNRNDDGRGRVHVCTGSFDEATCRTLVCEKDTVRGVPCSNTGVEFCCQMPDLMLYAHLYADCSNSNCEPGFFAQCEDFGGTIIDGPCATPDSTRSAFETPAPPDDNDDSGFCAVSGYSHRAPTLPWIIGVGVLALGAARRRRR